MEKQRLWMLSFPPILLLIRTPHIIFYLSLLVSLVPLATAVSFDFPSFDRETKFTCFPNQTGICLQGDAVLNDGLQLTKNKLHTSLASSVGRAVYSQPVHIWDSATRQMTDFITQFSFIIHDVDPQIPSGDGLAFFLSSYPSVIPDNSTGGFIGLFPNSSHSYGHASVVAIEFDTYPNGELDSSSADHIGINLSSIRSVVDLPMEGGIKKRILAKVRVEYHANRQRLCVTLSYDDASVEGNYTLSHVMDLRDVLPEYVSIGFSAATGLLVQTHTIFSWTFESNLDTSGSGTAKVLVLWAALFVGVTLALLLVWNWRKSNARRREEAIEDALMPSEKMSKTKEYSNVNAEDIKEKRGKEDGTGVDTVLRAKSGQGLMVDEDDCLDGMSLEKVGGRSQNQLISLDSETLAKQEEGQKDEDVNLDGISVEAGGSQNQVISSDTEACTSQAAGQKDEGVNLDLDGISLEEAGGSQNQVIRPDSTPFTRQEARQKDEDGSLEEVGGSQNVAISSGSETFSRQGRGQKEKNISVDAACLDEDGHGITESEKIKKTVQTSHEREGGTNLDEVNTDASVVEEGEGSHIEAPIHMNLLDRWSPKEIPYHVLMHATNNFSEEMMLGKGGFGPVYRGFLSYLGLDVAIKKRSERSEQGMSEYMAEVNIITQLRHRNLVKLVGWCHERGELMLVYELMPNGSLDNYLFKDNNLLEWLVRYKIALGLANALMYLHDECEPYVLHRDIKSSNVLLDSKLDAKLADFGLARLFNLDISTLRVTHPAGTRGYWAPEYALMCKASRRSDVYSYGVVALEIACGRKAILLAQQEEDVESSRTLLVEWVWDLYGEGAILDAADKRLNGNFDRAQMERMLMVGLWCAHPDHRQRPSIRQASNALLYPEATPLPALPDRTPPWAFPLDLMQMQVAQSSPMSLASPTSTSSDTSDDPMSSTAQLERRGDRVLHTSPGPALLRKPKRPLIARFTGWLKRKKATSDDEALADEIRMWSWLKEFSYNELIQATDNFSSKLGEGGFGSVYRGQLVSGLNVAVKRFGSHQQVEVYTTVVKTLGRLAPRNLVQLVGWCLEHGEHLLVYEYMANGTLDRHLFGCSTIPWEVRYKAVFSLASALCFLHNDLEQCVLHRDIIPRHLYFDEEFNMKLGGFALARLLEIRDTVLTSRIIGTYGYMAPEYCTSGRYTTASDVYSFGAVALEIACGRRYFQWSPVSTRDYDRSRQWVWRLYVSGNLLEASDVRLMGNFDSREMERLMVVGLWCTDDDPAQRPPMATVLRVLQFTEDPPSLQVPPDGLISTTCGNRSPPAFYPSNAASGIDLLSQLAIKWLEREDQPKEGWVENFDSYIYESVLFKNVFRRKIHIQGRRLG